MTEEKVTLDGIMDTMKGWVESKTPIHPHTWLDGAHKMAVLLSDLHDELIDAKMKAERLERNEKQITQFIQIAKKRADLKQYE